MLRMYEGDIHKISYPLRDLPLRFENYLHITSPLQYQHRNAIMCCIFEICSSAQNKWSQKIEFEHESRFIYIALSNRCFVLLSSCWPCVFYSHNSVVWHFYEWKRVHWAHMELNEYKEQLFYSWKSYRWPRFKKNFLNKSEALLMWYVCLYIDLSPQSGLWARHLHVFTPAFEWVT